MKNIIFAFLFVLASFASWAEVTSLKDFSGAKISVSVLSEEEARQVYAKILKWDHIPFKYGDDGCDARAFEIGHLLEKKESILVGKIFIEGEIWVESPNISTGEVGWWMHVAPFVVVRKGKKNTVMVIDPTLFDKLVSKEEWVRRLKQHRNTHVDRVFYKDRFHYDSGTRDMQILKYRGEDLEKTARRLEKFKAMLDFN